ncbi:hypothetical protein AD998_15110 [bacterium 336/3]|nr:hypothetical protein AD998_15110 [bacterium 336/3]
MKILNSAYNIILICFLTLLCFQTNAQNKAELTIVIQECHRDSAFTYVSELKIYKNNTYYMTLTSELRGISMEFLKDLEFGTYTFMYKTFIGKENTITLNITKAEMYFLTICADFIDYSKEKYKPIIDQLGENDSYSICFSSVGCYHSFKKFIIIKRENDKYSIVWGDKSKELTTQDIENIRRFEVESNYVRTCCCTTSDTYVIEYKGEKKQLMMVAVTGVEVTI